MQINLSVDLSIETNQIRVDEQILQSPEEVFAFVAMVTIAADQLWPETGRQLAAARQEIAKQAQQEQPKGVLLVDPKETKLCPECGRLYGLCKHTEAKP